MVRLPEGSRWTSLEAEFVTDASHQLHGDEGEILNPRPVSAVRRARRLLEHPGRHPQPPAAS